MDVQHGPEHLDAAASRSALSEGCALLERGLGALGDQEVARLGSAELRERALVLLATRGQLEAELARSLRELAERGDLDGVPVHRWLADASAEHGLPALAPAERTRLVKRVDALALLPRLTRLVETGVVSAAALEQAVTEVRQLPEDVRPDFDGWCAGLGRVCDGDAVRAVAAHVRAAVDEDGRRDRAQDLEDGRGASLAASTLHGVTGWSLRAQLDHQGGAVVSHVLGVLAAPRSADDRRPARVRLADALVAMAELAAAARAEAREGRVPEGVGSLTPRVVVVTTEEALAGTPGAPPAQDVDGHPVDGGELEAAFCTARLLGQVDLAVLAGLPADPADPTRDDEPEGWELLRQRAAGLLPAPLAPRAHVLDLHRTRRLASPAQLRALALRDCGCVWPGCDAPVSWTQGHHLAEHDADEGSTDLANLALLCTAHHHQLHRQHQHLVWVPNGLAEQCRGCVDGPLTPGGHLFPERLRRHYDHAPPAPPGPDDPRPGAWYRIEDDTWQHWRRQHGLPAPGLAPLPGPTSTR